MVVEKVEAGGFAGGLDSEDWETMQGGDWEIEGSYCLLEQCSSPLSII